MGIKLDPNSWQDAEWWYEDEQDVFQFMRKNEEIIKKYAQEHNMTIKNAIDFLFEKWE